MEITLRKLIECYKALENAGELNAEFDDYMMVHDLSLNKKAMEPHFEAIKLMNRSCPEYQKYQKAFNSIRNRHISDKQALKNAIEELNESEETRIAIEKENERLERWELELDKKVIVKNIKLLKRTNKSGEPTIRGNNSAVLNFIQKIEPLFEPILIEDESKQENKKLDKK